MFHEFPKQATCPICGTNKGGQCFLVPIDGTQVKFTAEARCVHVSCVEEHACYNHEMNIVYCKGKS